MGIGYRLGEWTVRPHRNRIERGNESAHLEPKAMAVLDCLARASNSVVTRQQIFDSVWPSASVSDEVLTQRIAEIRKAFGDSAKQPKIVETIPKIGFRLIPRVVPLSEDLESGSKTHRPFAAGHGLKWFAILVLGLVVVASYFWVTRPTAQQLLTGPAGPSIAVLPFLNRSEDPGDEHLSDGISDELINLLVQVPGLEVRSRSSSFSFKGENWKMEDIARELNASLIVDGQVRKVDKRAHYDSAY